MERLEASVHPDDWDLVRGAIERSAHAGEPVNVEYRILPGERPRAVDLVPWAAQFDVHRRAGAPDGHLRRHHRAQARRGGASRERGSPGGGSRARRPRVLRGGLRRRASSTSTTGFATSAAFPRTGSRASRPWSSGWSTCIPTTAPACWSCAEQLHDGRLDRLSVEYRFLHPGQEQKWIQHIGRVAAARRHRTHGQVVRRPPRHHRTQARRG